MAFSWSKLLSLNLTEWYLYEASSRYTDKQGRMILSPRTCRWCYNFLYSKRIKSTFARQWHSYRLICDEIWRTPSNRNMDCQLIRMTICKKLLGYSIVEFLLSQSNRRRNRDICESLVLSTREYVLGGLNRLEMVGDILRISISDGFPDPLI